MRSSSPLPTSRYTKINIPRDLKNRIRKKGKIIVNRDKDRERIERFQEKGEEEEEKAWMNGERSRVGSTWQSFTHTTTKEGVEGEEEKGVLEGEEEKGVLEGEEEKGAMEGEGGENRRGRNEMKGRGKDRRGYWRGRGGRGYWRGGEGDESEGEG